MSTSLRLTRRRFVQGLTVGAAALGSVPTQRAAADSKMVLGTWGGDYSKLLTQNVETPILKPKGIEVVHDIAGDSQRRAKLIAEQRLPRGTTDLQALSAAGSREMCNAGILESVDYGFFTDPYYVAMLVRTVRVAAICMVVCLVLGFPLAYALARTRSRWKSALIMLVVLPLFVGNAVRAAGWMVMFGSRGLLNTLLGAAGLIHQPVQLMYTEAAVIVGIAAVNLPFMVLALQSVIEGIDPPWRRLPSTWGRGPCKCSGA